MSYLTEKEKPDRKKYMAEYYKQKKEEIAQQRKARRITFNDEINAASRERYARDPEAREQARAKSARHRKKKKEKLPTDPELQEKHQAYLAMRREKHKERMANDPAYRKMCAAYNIKQREKRKLKKEQAQL